MRRLALLLLALPLTACGGVSVNAVARAATKATASGSEHVEMTATVAASGQTLTMSGSGDFQTSPSLGAMHLSVDSGTQKIAMDEVMKGSTIYLKSPLLAQSPLVPAGKHWVAINLAKAGAKLGTNFSQYAQGDPTDILGALKKVGSVKRVGSETVGGVATTHYNATVDLSKAPNGARLRKLAKLNHVPVDVWIDNSNLLRRMKMSFQSITTQMDFSNYGEQVNVQVPSASETVDMTTLGG